MNNIEIEEQLICECLIREITKANPPSTLHDLHTIYADMQQLCQDTTKESFHFLDLCKKCGIKVTR